MRNLIAAVLVATSISAQAVEFSAPNKAGGEIRLTDVPCKNGTSYVLYSFSSSGGASYGCFFINGDMVHISWNDGTNGIMPTGYFKKVNATPTNKGTQL